MEKLFCAAVLSALISAITYAQENPGGKAAEQSAPKEEVLNYSLDDFRNYYGSWAELSPLDSLIYCRNMGYKYVIYRGGMERYKESNGLRFLLVDPEFMAYNRNLDMKKSYSQKVIDMWRDICAMKDASAPFPDCMATGWFWAKHSRDKNPDFSKCSLQLNFQKQKVIDMAVDKIIKKAKDIMKKNPNFKYGGCIWDVPMLTGDFYGKKPEWKRPRQVDMSFWRGVDSVSVPEGVKLDYPTYSEGYLAYFRKLRQESLKISPDAKFIVDPWDVYRDYIAHFKRLNVPHTDPGFADFIQTEANNDRFVTDKRIAESGYIDLPHQGQASDLSTYDFDKEIKLVSAAAVKGVWTSWFGNPCPGLPSIRDVPARMKITRAIGTWENLNNTPLSQRKWDASKNVYSSPTAYMSKDLVWAIQPKTNKLFFCILSPDAYVDLPEKWEIEKIHALTSIFSEYLRPDLEKNFDVAGNALAFKPNSRYLVGQGFVAYLKDKGEKK